MSKQTAVDWLWNELKAYNVNIASDLVAQFNQAKQMEKEQMYEFWLNGMKCDSGEGSSFDKYMEIKYEGKI
jgi:hypothetical protein